MNIAIVTAGGTGARMGTADTPKQFIEIYGKPILVHALEAFDINDRIDGICLVTMEEWMDDAHIWTKRFDVRKVRWYTTAGNERHESIYNGLKMIEADVSPDDIILIHDAARPLISQRIIDNNIDIALKHGSALTCVPSSDSIARSLDGVTVHSQPLRNELYISQTPQTFKFSTIMEAHRHYRNFEGDKPAITDDVGMVMFNGGTVAMAPGDRTNMKVTTFDDLMMVKSIIRSSRS